MAKYEFDHVNDDNIRFSLGIKVQRNGYVGGTQTLWSTNIGSLVTYQHMVLSIEYTLI